MYMRGGIGRARIRACDTAPERLSELRAAVAQTGSLTLMIGDQGMGKRFLAEQAAHEIAEELRGGILVVSLPQPPRPESGIASVFADEATGAPDPSARAERVLARLRDEAGEREIVLIASDVDDYTLHDLEALEALAGDPALRIVLTARQHGRALAAFTRRRRAQTVVIPPLSLAEAQRYAAALIGVEQIEPETLRRWHEWSGGNCYQLSALVANEERSGALRRSRGYAWVVPGQGEISGDLRELRTAEHTPAQWEAIEFVAQAEPVTELALLRRLDAAVLSSLLDSGVLVSSNTPTGMKLEMGHRLLGASVRAAMSPLRRLQVNEEIFRVLRSDLDSLDPARAQERIARLVAFGLECAYPLSLDWLWPTFEAVARQGDPHFALRVAIAVAAHPDADGVQCGTAAGWAMRVARLLGDEPASRSIARIMRELLDDEERSAQAGAALRSSLELELQLARFFSREAELEALLERTGEIEETSPRLQAEYARSYRVLMLALSGKLGEAGEAAPEHAVSEEIEIEWARSPARAVTAVLAAQRGQFRLAAETAETARRLNELGPRSGGDLSDIQGLCWLLAHWAAGEIDDALCVLGILQGGAPHLTVGTSGVVKTGALLVSLQQGNWREAAQHSEVLLDALESCDGYGIAPLVQAGYALALAALGERDGAIQALHSASHPPRGIARALSGFRRLLLLRAKQWLHDDEVLADARALTETARQEGLPLIELHALHIAAMTDPVYARAGMERARILAEQIEGALAARLLAHISRIATRPGSVSRDAWYAVAAGEEPEVRMLAELGVWLPLPPAPALTPREREIMVLAALEHSSRFIAERLHISVRTVDSHLAHIFAKLGIERRDELWRWVARNRMLAAA